MSLLGKETVCEAVMMVTAGVSANGDYGPDLTDLPTKDGAHLKNGESANHFGVSA